MQIKFSKIEIRDLAKAWIVISIAFAIVLSGGIFGVDFLLNVILAAITVGTGFLFHELGHKFVAQKYGCFAEFRADNYMLFLAIIISFLGVVFAAPGAVMISGRVSKERNGKISIAGPAVNLVFALMFLALFFFIQEGFIGRIFAFGYLINSWLALFNLLPFWILDGKKVLRWNKLVYFISLGMAISFVVLSWILPLNLF
ncbi:hypothetical protein HN681_02365 [archaeon]|jgi:Zn-dependent protease|nr:hypothetical protein [archaeon]MBT3731301.1 hypothetical protein [archaeon]MBT4669954.1 hypothetical protein [archaeon]MBT5029779.1 hypothetical protein [archaeon]MBT5287472.1 hypothetical protein [archaeon]